MNDLSSVYNSKILGIQNISIDLSRIKEKRYFLKKAYQILIDPNRSTDVDSVQWRVSLIRCLESILRTQFVNTRDFNRKIREFLRDFDIRKAPAGERIRKARNKIRISQKQLAEQLGFKSHAVIAQYERGHRYPNSKVFQWLEEQECNRKRAC